MKVKAYAKVNLFLEITGKRPDGYHNLSTLFQMISLCDELTLSPARTLELSCSDASLPTDDRNLALRAAQLLQSALLESRGARIHLKKNIPMGAGLGGGSSDAACVLTALPKLWKRRVPASLLHRLARGLGADVPYFLQGGTCAASGIGDRLHPMSPLSKTWMVLVYPGFAISTKQAYSNVHLPWRDPRRMHQKNPLQYLFNRFEELLFPDHLELPEIKQRLLELGAHAALMSGSGSSVFGLVQSHARGRQILSQIKPRYPQSWLVHSL
jgi:4-diphosphocytidyl-2-C-methyl-D-erythritol kinase